METVSETVFFAKHPSSDRQAQKDSSDLVVFLVHEFRTPLTSEENPLRNCKE
jgi:hypothetical protein